MSPVAQQPTLDGFSSKHVPPPAVTVYTDGGCDPNPGPGGWAAVLHIAAADAPDAGGAPTEIVLTGNAPQSTNNRMELEAAIGALAYLQGRYGACEVDLHTDSTYVRAGISEWIERWAANGWQTRGRQAVKNRDLWHRLYALSQALTVRWHWVKGHAGDPLNERVDRLAGQARARLTRSAAELPSLDVEPPPAAGADVPGPDVQLSLAVLCPGGRGPGGWAAVLSSDAEKKVLSGSEAETTSVRLVLQAALAGLRALKTPSRVTVYTTEEYLSKGASEWVHKWRQRGWMTSGKKPVQHGALWRALLHAAAPHHVTWQFVRQGALTAGLAEAKQAAARALQSA